MRYCVYISLFSASQIMTVDIIVVLINLVTLAGIEVKPFELFGIQVCKIFSIKYYFRLYIFIVLILSWSNLKLITNH